MMMRLAAALMATVTVAGAPTALSAAAANCRNTAGFERWLEEFKREALSQGVSQRAIAIASPYLRYDQGIINRDRGQRFFGQDFLTFSGKMLPAYRLQQGAQQMQKHAALFQRVEQRFGVPAPVLVAFWGLESDFGSMAGMGKLSVLPAITTLAYDCRRPEMFRPELIAALQLIDRGDLMPNEMVGSWAGELGQTQFMPTLYIKYGIDFDGDGKRDLIRNVADVMASTANYLMDVGWKRDEPWLQEVRVPANLAWDQADLSIQHPRSQWARWGMSLADGRALPADSLPASLLLPMGRFGPAFLVYDNFKVYRIWNASLVYATTAAYYATRLAGAPPMRSPPGPISSLSQEQTKELQILLAQRAYDVGKIDGILGAQSRTAVKAMQVRFGLPADSWPTLELLARMRTRQ